MEHYFKVQRMPEHEIQRRRKGFLASWFSGLSVTGWLIAVNIAVFFIILIMNQFTDATKFFALQPKALFENFGLNFWTVLTSMFSHVMFFHLFVNMFSLYFIGRFLEMIIGRKRFFWIYMASGIFAGIFFAVLSYFLGNSEIGAKIFGNPEIFAVGASGAIFGVAGVLALLTPKNRVYLIGGPLIALILEAIAYAFMPNNPLLSVIDIFVSIYIFFSIFAMLSFSNNMKKFAVPIEMPFWVLPIVAITPLIIIGLFVELPIGNMAHLGGFIAGAAYGLYLRIKYKKKVEAISRYFSRQR